MPSTWGTNDRRSGDRLSDLRQYAKWFHASGYDFSLKSVAGRWECLAWSQGDIELSFRGEATSEPVDALHSCYTKMRDLGIVPK